LKAKESNDSKQINHKIKIKQEQNNSMSKERNKETIGLLQTKD